MPSVPTSMSSAATLGLARKPSVRWRMVGSSGSRRAASPRKALRWPATSTVRPWAAASSEVRSFATRSTTFSFSASSAVIDTLSRTAFSAQSGLRPRAAATERAKAAVSFSTFFAMSFPASFSTSPPPLVTGWAAPMLEVGCIPAT